MTSKVGAKKKRKPSKKAGFGTAHWLLILLLSTFSFGFVKDICGTLVSIDKFKRTYEAALDEKEVALQEMENLGVIKVKLNDPDYLLGYIRSSILYTKDGEQVFVIQGKKQ